LVLIIISEFADNIPGDDIKIIYHNSPILENDSLLSLVTPVFLGLYSTGGKTAEEKFGNIPIEKERVAITWSINAEENLRLIILIVSNSELDQVSKKIYENEIKHQIKELQDILKADKVDNYKMEKLCTQLGTALSDLDEVSRISKVFGEEI
jgi:hypothetical protein